MSLPTILFLGPAALCVLAWLGAGRAIPARVLPGDRLLDPLARIAAGSVAFTLLVFALGRAGVLEPAVLLGLTVALAVPGLWAAREAFQGARLPLGLGRLGWLLLGLAAVALVLDLVASSAPPSSADALVYHVEFPRRWLELHRIDDPFWNYAAFYPLGIETLYAQAMAVVGHGGAGSAMAAGSTASALHGLLTLLATVAVYGLGRALGGGRSLAGALAAALFALQGLVTWDSTSTFIDLGLVFYAVLAAWFAVRWVRRPSRVEAAWIGLACGGAAGAKYIGPLAVLFVLGPVALIAVLRRQRASAGWALGVALVVGAPWYVKNAIVTGNPLYPLLFGGKLWNARAERWVSEARSTTFPGTHSFPLRILILPLDLLLHGDRFDRGQFASTATLLLAPLALVVNRTREIVGVLAAAAGFTIVWWYAVPQTRYLLPVLGVLAAVAGAALAPLLLERGLRRAAVVGVVGAAAVVWLVSSAALTRQLLPVAFGAESRVAHVQRLTGTYDAMQAIGRRLGDAPVAFASSYNFIYWYPGPAIVLDLPEFSYELPRSVFLDRLRRSGVRDVVLWGDASQVPALATCAVHTADFPGFYVTSRSRGTSKPLVLSLYSVRTCLAGSARRNASVSRSASSVPISKNRSRAG